MSESRFAFVPAAAWPLPPELRRRTATRRFCDYIDTRKYDFGRGSASAWAFVAFARGDPDFPDVRSWRELNAYLVGRGADAGLIEAARRSWRSFKALQSRARRSAEDC